MTEPHEMDTLYIDHQDGPLRFRLKMGGYAVTQGRLTISIETENLENSFPDCALICIDNAPMTGDLIIGNVFACEGGMGFNNDDESDAARAHGYFTFHAEKCFVSWTVVSIQNHGRIVFSLSAIHDDVNYYDNRAKPSATCGIFSLPLVEREGLWVPK